MKKMKNLSRDMETAKKGTNWKCQKYTLSEIKKLLQWVYQQTGHK